MLIKKFKTEKELIEIFELNGHNYSIQNNKIIQHSTTNESKRYILIKNTKIIECLKCKNFIFCLNTLDLITKQYLLNNDCKKIKETKTKIEELKEYITFANINILNNKKEKI